MHLKSTKIIIIINIFENHKLESNMAIAMARNGGIGIIHRYLTIEDQVNYSFNLNSTHSNQKVAMVRRVKRAESYKVESPYTTTAEATFEQIENLMKENGVHSILGKALIGHDLLIFLVTDSQNKLMGIVTTRDMRFVEKGALVRHFFNITPSYPIIR
jgi:IMP dehydrogenase